MMQFEGIIALILVLIIMVKGFQISLKAEKATATVNWWYASQGSRAKCRLRHDELN